MIILSGLDMFALILIVVSLTVLVTAPATIYAMTKEQEEKAGTKRKKELAR